MKNKNKKIKIILKYIETYIFSILLFALTTTTILKTTILNKNFIQQQFTKEHYINVEMNIKTEMKRSMMSTRIEDTIIDELFDYKDIEKSTKQTINIIYTNNNQTIDTKKIENKLRNNIKKDLENKNLELDDETGYNIFVNSIIEIYKQEFQMLNHVARVGEIVKKIQKIITKIIIALLLLITIDIIIRKKIIKEIFPIALLTTSFLILFGIVYIYNKAGLSNTTVISLTFSTILRKIIKETFNVYKIIAILYIAISIISTSLKKYIKTK